MALPKNLDLKAIQALQDEGYLTPDAAGRLRYYYAPQGYWDDEQADAQAKDDYDYATYDDSERVSYPDPLSPEEQERGKAIARFYEGEGTVPSKLNYEPDFANMKIYQDTPTTSYGNGLKVSLGTPEIQDDYTAYDQLRKKQERGMQLEGPGDRRRDMLYAVQRPGRSSSGR